jgi:hypothetical protein
MSPEYKVTVENLEDCEPFVHNELDVSVVRQACQEWSAKALVVWTLGAGSAVLAGILGELPTVGLALCDTHLLMAAHVIDSAIANRMQVDFKGNKLYDADLHQRAVHAMGGGDSESEEKKKAPRRRSRARICRWTKRTKPRQRSPTKTTMLTTTTTRATPATIPVRTAVPNETAEALTLGVALAPRNALHCCSDRGVALSGELLAMRCIAALSGELI